MKRLYILLIVLPFLCGCFATKVAKLNQEIEGIDAEIAALEEQPDSPDKDAVINHLNNKKKDLEKKRQTLKEQGEMAGNLLQGLLVVLGTIFGIPALAGVGAVAKKLVAPSKA